MKTAGIYIDFPFCIARCAFCAFNIQGYREGLAERYETALHHEIALHVQMKRLQDRRIVSLYLGGGTPTRYPARTLTQIVQACRNGFDLQDDAEVTVEAHPATINKAYLKEIHEGGINRLSMGVQSFSDEQLTKLGRHHTVDEALLAFDAAREAGFDRIGIDLIYGLPDQTIADWEKTLQTAIGLDPEHLSIYSLSIEEGTTFHRQGVAAASEEDQIAMYQWAQQALYAAGFLQYEISNFAKAGCASRHNLLYWNRAETLGIGLSAHSYIDRRHETNIDLLTSYLKQIEAGRLPIKQVSSVSEEEERTDRIVFGLRKQEGIPKADLQWNQNQITQVAFLMGEGLLTEDQSRIRLTPKGMLLADEVAIALL